jgi:hypothetical protein
MEPSADLLDDQDRSRLGGTQGEEYAQEVESAVREAPRRDPPSSLLYKHRHDVPQLLDLYEVEVFELRSAELREPGDQRSALLRVGAEVGEHAGEVLPLVAEWCPPAAVAAHQGRLDVEKVNHGQRNDEFERDIWLWQAQVPTKLEAKTFGRLKFDGLGNRGDHF